MRGRGMRGVAVPSAVARRIVGCADIVKVFALALKRIELNWNGDLIKAGEKKNLKRWKRAL
jgi:hypothetical protein